MATLSSGVQLRMSGGAANSNPLSSLGGPMSSFQVTAAFYDAVTNAERTTGDVEFRIGYVCNTGTTTAKGVRVYIPNNTPSASTKMEIGMGTSGLNGTEPTMPTEGAVPSGVTFSEAPNADAGLMIGDLPAGQWRAVVFRWTITAGVAVSDADIAKIQLAWSYEE